MDLRAIENDDEAENSSFLSYLSNSLAAGKVKKKMSFSITLTARDYNENKSSTKLYKTCFDFGCGLNVSIAAYVHIYISDAKKYIVYRTEMRFIVP